MLCLAELQTVCREYHAKILTLEGDKYDLEWQSRVKDYAVKITDSLSKNARLQFNTFWAFAIK